jgi:hypothetical protein
MIICGWFTGCFRSWSEIVVLFPLRLIHKALFHYLVICQFWLFKFILLILPGHLINEIIWFELGFNHFAESQHGQISSVVLVFLFNRFLLHFDRFLLHFDILSLAIFPLDWFWSLNLRLLLFLWAIRNSANWFSFGFFLNDRFWFSFHKRWWWVSWLR